MTARYVATRRQLRGVAESLIAGPQYRMAGTIRLAALGIARSGTLGLLVDAKRHGLVTAVAPLLDELQRNGFHVSLQLRDAILEAAAELP